MKFFIPHAKDDKQAEDVYESTKKFAKQQMSWEIADRRIRKLQYSHEGKDFVAEVGKVESRTGEEVIAILESRTFLICTPRRGVLGGEPMMVGKNDAHHVEDFE